MQYWIDGHNLIGKIPDLDLSDPDDEAKLVRQIKQWASRDRRRHVTLFFDAGLPGGEVRQWSGGRVTVIFASVGRTADSLILYRIRQVDRKAGPEYTIITSDQAIIQGVKKQRMAHIYSEVFAAMMAVEAKPAPPPVNVDPQLNDTEINEWLNLFGPEPELPPPATPSRQRDKLPPADPHIPTKATTPELRPRKTARVHLTPDEVDAWMALFAAAAPLPEDPAPKTEPERGREVKPPTIPPSTTLPTRKRTTSKLSRDEVDAWMDVFKSGKEK
ncbi:MAG: NYN domain-containing protein [Chloroflexi bacterium]|nr:NYN domain-containing protein [Chloroflexota bacterium]MBP8059064.1 NYN domain-containing protein [Chloroflexota bacterium]